MADKVAFLGIIKSINSSIDAVGDKVGKLTVTFRPEGDVIANLDAMQKPDKEVYIVIVEKPNEKQKDPGPQKARGGASV